MVGSRRIAAVAVTVLLSACAAQKKLPVLETSQINPATSNETLATRQKAVAIMKIGQTNVPCQIANAVIGVRDSDGYKPVRNLQIVGTTNPLGAHAAEAELDPGEYHIIGYICTAGQQTTVIAGVDQGKFYRSYASFTLAAGEMVNIGYLKLAPLPFVPNVYNVAVTDWALGDLETFKKQRPAIFNQMKTRLATVIKADPVADAQEKVMCERAKGMLAQGKLQNLPQACLPRPANKAAPGRSGKKDLDT
jgi:hypothetical protein